MLGPIRSDPWQLLGPGCVCMCVLPTRDWCVLCCVMYMRSVCVAVALIRVVGVL